jgi:hypothetical protein
MFFCSSGRRSYRATKQNDKASMCGEKKREEETRDRVKDGVKDGRE